MREFSDKLLILITGELSSLNLTRITDPDEFFHKQIMDSVLPLEKFPLFKRCVENGLHLDIGFGGGFPLLPLAYLYPETKFLGFEARRKKSDAVNLLANRLGLENVQTFHRRIETIDIDLPCSLSFKAVGKMKEFLGKTHISDSGTVFFYKGPNVYDLEGAPEKIAYFRKVLDQGYEVSGAQGRTFIAYEATNVPRGTNKNLVKLSQFL